MDVLLSKSSLLRLLKRSQNIAGHDKTMPILSHCLIGAADGKLTMSTTDLNLSFVGACGAAVKEPGSIAVDARGLSERVKAMPDGDLTLTTKGTTLTIKPADGKRRFTVHGLDADSFPNIPEPAAESYALELDVATVLDLIHSTAYAISTDETRLHLNSGFLEASDGKLRMVATDGHRLAVKEVDSKLAFPPMLLPLKGVLELKRLLEETDAETVTLKRHGSRLFCEVDGDRFALKLTDSQFVPWQQVVPASTTRTFGVDRAALAEAVRAVAVAASDRTNGIALKLASGGLKIESQSPDGGDGADELAVDYDGAEASVGMNSAYLVDALGPVSLDTVMLGTSDELDPVVIRDGGYVAVLMPMRTA
jgi:DNA polymerase-3 subunit beta